MKTLMICLCINFNIINSVFPQSDPIQKAEILINNSTVHVYFIKVYPVGSVFSGLWSTQSDSTFYRKYSLLRSKKNSDPFWPKNPEDSIKYIVGGKKSVQSNSFAVVDFDDGDYFDQYENRDKVIGGVSYGLWKFEFYYTPDAQSEEENVDLIAECYIDYRDVNHGQYSYTNDIYFNLVRKQNADNDSLLFNWKSGDTLNIFDSRVNNRIIKSWHKVGLPGDPSIPGSPDAGLFKTLPFKFPEFPIDATQYGAVAHINPGEISMNLEIDSNGSKIKCNSTLNFKYAFIKIKSGINFSLEDSSDIFLYNSKLSTEETIGLKSFLMGSNSGINLLNGSSVNFRNTNFHTVSNNIWNGIHIINSGIDSIINCTFSNAKNSLSFINEPGYTFVPRLIKGNTFNIPPGAGSNYTGIYGENNFRITIEDNVFNMPSNPSNFVFGVYLKNNNTEITESQFPLPEENDPPVSPFSIYLIHNTFSNGTASAMLLNYTSSYLPFYVKGNTFNSAGSIGLLGRSISGMIKDNVISGTGLLIPTGIHLIASSPGLVSNAVSSENVSLHTIGSSYPNLAPVVQGSSLLWKGGKNRFYSNQSDNVQLVHAANVYTNLGENRFTVSDTSANNYHIYGWVDTTVQMYFGRNN